MPRTLPLALAVLLVLCACWSECLQSTEYQHTIYIDPGNPNSINDSSCYTNSVEHPCGDINIALAFPDKQHSTVFHLSSNANHKLANNATNMLFTEGSQIAFVGDNGTATVECMEGAGLAFINSTNININRVSFLYCGAWRPSTSSNFTSNTLQLILIRVGLYFYNCRNVNMSRMSVSNSTEAVGVVMYSVAGENYIDNSHFDNNRISESNKNESGGGGFAVEFNYCKPGDDTCGENNTQTANNSDAVYTFENCSFIFNRAIDQSGKNQTDISILPRKEIHYSLGRGGGLSLYFKGTAMKNNITVRNCSFYHNHATWGAGMIIELVDRAIQNFVFVVDSHFTRNHCYYVDSNDFKGGPGGGIRMASFIYFPKMLNESLQRNSFLIKSCIFHDNRAIYGGALSISFHRQLNVHRHQLAQANISGSVFQFNSARLGSAVSVDRDHYFARGDLGTAYFRACTFNNNSIVYEKARAYSVGIGALYISEVAVVFEEYHYFQYNKGTALAIVGTTLTFSDYVTVLFISNTGSQGGAISLLGMASVIMGANTNITFENNYASLYGGAIFNNYIGKEDLRSSVKCFLQYFDPFVAPKKWLTQFVFKGNKAEKLGHSIFSTTILPCSWSEGTEADSNVAEKIFCWSNSTWVYVNSSCDEQIRTYPKTFNLSNATQRIFPGHNFQMGIVAMDDLNHNVTLDTVYTAVTNNSISKVDPRFTYIADGYVSVTGKEEEETILKLNTAGSRDWGIHLNLTISKCPPGFLAQAPESTVSIDGSKSYDKSQSACECIGGSDIFSFEKNLLCDKPKLVSKIRNGYWIGIVPSINNTALYMGTTSLLYNYAQTDFFSIDQDYDQLDHKQCAFLNRTGPLCGKCRDGFSTAVNSHNYECVPCERNTTNLIANVFTYIGLTYVPYVIIFIVITCCDIRLMSGPLVSFILYAQLIGSGVTNLTAVTSTPYTIKDEENPHISQEADTSHMIVILQKAYRIAYGLFNLNSLSDVMDPFCVRENFTALDVICLDYAVAVFPLLPIFTVYVVMHLRHFKLCAKKKRRITNVSGAMARANVDKAPERSMLHPLVSFIYLSYTKFTLTSTKLLSTTSVFDKDGAPGGYLVYYAGQYQFGEPQYIWPYGVLAISVFIIFAIFFPLVFLGLIDFINWLLDKPRFQSLQRFWPTLTVNHYMDAFQGCYEPKQRYFTGLYFVLRLIVFVVYAFSVNEVLSKIWQLVFLFLIVIAVSFKQPYRVKLFNYLDIAIFFNLALINFISIYLYSENAKNVHSSYPAAFYVIGVILIWLPMVYFVLYICYLLFHKTPIYKNSTRRLLHLTTRLRNRWRNFCGEPAVEEPEQQQLLNPATRGRMYSGEITNDGLTDNDMFNRAKETSRSKNKPNRQKKVTSSVVVADGIEGIADVYGTSVTVSSGIATGESGRLSTGTGSSKSSDVQVTDNEEHQ